MTEPALLLGHEEITDARNPYVGPRPFRSNEEHLFFGRERDAAAVVDSLISSRVMLLHSPSGAGKTSIIQIAVVPAFRRRKFHIAARFDPGFSALRVNLPPPRRLTGVNRYVFSLTNALVGDFTAEARTAQLSIREALDAHAAHHGAADRPQLLVIDQMEEVLTLERGDAEGQEEFFRQLGEALDNPRRWALLAIREDYIGALDRFRPSLPGQLRSTFRLDLLDARSAVPAVAKPAQTKGIDFDERAVELLVNELRLVHSGQAGEKRPTVKHPYVEPVLLQVVCYSLFKQLEKDRGDRFRKITPGDVKKFKPFDKALAAYYRDVVKDAGGGDPDVEHLIRHWVEHDLVSERRLRAQSRAKPPVDDPDDVLASLQTSYLVREDPRPGGTELWELSHDLLVAPVLDDNRSWRKKALPRWRVQAEEWWASGQSSLYLLDAAAYHDARVASRSLRLTETEKSFLKASKQAVKTTEAARVTAERARQRVRRLGTAFGVVGALLLLSLMLNVALLTARWT
ncbi:nSTAND1 domain-containing NTPase [Nocardioides mangrovi]|uniref:Novel STAND NTPase 1 domain-containing protein n=1 Tax=Nocardioides mangrovi TaxID=2874580 RepID=A0ABS7UGX8_9ACTN|nr:hypothetical protein [Nocardioides mangrovi]MBZ5740288.1 hypothetical protein [Nocardioides mangrovi]